MSKTPKCIVCSSSNFTPKRSKLDYQMGTCSNCSLAYMTPFSKGNKDEVGDSNSTITSVNYYSNILKGYKAQSKLAKKKAPNMLKYWNKYNNKITSILEVGCGTGQYYEAWKELGIHWIGLEVNNEIINFCHKKHIPVKRFDDHIKDNNKYDVIFLSQVMEHILEPHKFLLQLKKFMTTDTILHIDVPNHDSITSLYRRINIFHQHYGFVQPYGHQIAYTKKAMSFLLRDNSFQIINIATYANNHPVFGQLITNKSVINKLFFFLSRIINRGSLLVCIVRKQP